MAVYDRALHRGLLLVELLVAVVALVCRKCLNGTARVVRAAVASLVWAAEWATRRDTVAGTCMVAGVAAASYGGYLQWGLGVGLLITAGLLIPLSLLIGWEK